MEIRKLAHGQDATIRELIPTLNEFGFALVVASDSRLLGFVSAGDVRRALISEKNLDASVQAIMNASFVALHYATPPEEIDRVVAQKNVGSDIPLIDEKGKLVGLYSSNSYRRPEIDLSDENLYANPDADLLVVMRKIDLTGLGIALVVENRKLIGLVTDKDIRLSISHGMPLQTPVKEIMNREPFCVPASESKEQTARRLVQSTIRGNVKIPVLDPEGYVVGLVRAEKYENTALFMRNIHPSKTVLVTGGAGYLGSLLVRKLLRRGYSVRILDKLLYGDDSIKELIHKPNFELIQGDIRHIETVVQALQSVDAVIHLAGIVGDPACALSPTRTIEQNKLASILIANACKYHQINRFVFASSCSVYGQSCEVLTENSGLNPVSIYARDKIETEGALSKLEDENFSPTILRMGTLYGLSPRPRFDLVLNIMTGLAVTKKEFSIFGGDQWRPMLHVDDAAEAYISVLEAPLEKVKGQVFNVGSDQQNYRISEIGRKILQVIPEVSISADDRVTDKRDYRVSFQKIRESLQFRAKSTIEDGIREIKEAIESGDILDISQKEYCNHKFLQEWIE